MLRSVLVLALLLRLAPAPAGVGGSTHCTAFGAGDATALAGQEHQHHHAPGTDGPEAASTDTGCDHCPPTECAQQLSCQSAALLLATLDRPATAPPPASGLMRNGAALAWSTLRTAPPTRPPVTTLA